jgi:RNA polymerase sigma-70 factor (ECF subfamily)
MAIESPATGKTRQPGEVGVGRALAECHDILLRYLVRSIGNRMTAEDILHDAIVRALERSEQLREAGNVRAWFERILRSALADYWRKKMLDARRQRVLERISTERDTADDAGSHACRCVHELLPTIAPAYADLLWHADMLGEPRQTIAAAMHTTPGTVAVRLHRARRALRSRLVAACTGCRETGFFDCGCGTKLPQTKEKGE